eukprot:TRINITY_DN1425_c2_g3_i1.p1 TRINITY_DN1425_c2_g3~~TRINITY_DN1425_c2_g3_i1.p1  ORF type:complete len:188 (+),score=40.39 TRINITY_DN1425_c2_g3_i1:55-618(+)
MQARTQLAKQGERAFEKMTKINAELFVITYGSLVTQLLEDTGGCVEEVNTQLEMMGYKIGVRLIDEYLAKANTSCRTFKDTAEAIAKVGFKMFLGISAQVNNWAENGEEYSITLDENPLTTFAELPAKYQGLWFSNVLCGVIRGALEMVTWRVEAVFVKDVLRGDECTEIRITLLERLKDEFKQDDD